MQDLGLVLSDNLSRWLLHALKSWINPQRSHWEKVKQTSTVLYSTNMASLLVSVSQHIARKRDYISENKYLTLFVIYLSYLIWYLSFSHWTYLSTSSTMKCEVPYFYMNTTFNVYMTIPTGSLYLSHHFNDVYDYCHLII